jgi:hypothetical protein
MTVVAFVLLLTIPVAMLAKRNIFSTLLAGLWGFFLGMTPMGPTLAGILNNLGGTILGVFGGGGPA